MIRAQWKICESCGLPSILDRGRISHQGLRWTTRNLLQEKIDFPALPGWADVWRSALRALLLWRSLPCHFSLYLPQASQLLGMTKGSVGFPVGIGCKDPRSQKRDLGHPSITSDAVGSSSTAVAHNSREKWRDVGYRGLGEGQGFQQPPAMEGMTRTSSPSLNAYSSLPRKRMSSSLT
jgi:hypothetical protein